MRVLIDECLPRMLARRLTGHDVVTVQAAGWAGVSNGRLLSIAEERFDVFVTADRRLKHQQNLRQLAINVIVLPSNRRSLVEKLVPVLCETLAALASDRPGRCLEISLP